MKAYHYILATVLGMLAVSCTREIDEPVVPEQPGDYLVISLRSEDGPQSRAAAADTLSVVPFEGGMPVELQGMELVGTAVDWPCEDIEEVVTKGQLVSGHADMHGNSIIGYFDQYDTNAGYRKYAYNESFSWISSGSNQCRSANRFLFGNGQKYRFTFVWPETVALNDNLQATCSVGTDVKEQKELLYSTQEVNVTSGLSTLTVPFSHALSRVNLKTTSTCPSLTINYIMLSDVYYTGTFSAITGDITPGTSYKTSFLLAEDISVTGEADLCSGDRSFLVMPQTVPSSGRLEVGFTYEGKQHTVTANLSGNNWEKGKIITYTLNFNKINGWIKQITIPDELTVNVNETKSITASVTPSTATLKKVTWGQTDASRATLASAGDLVTNVTGKTVGNTSVKATAADGSEVESNNCIVHVIDQIRTLTVEPSAANICNGQTQQFTATVTYWSGTTKSVTSGSSWSSSSPSVATVSSGGLATASATNTGQTTISASYTEDGVTLSGSAVLTVSEPVLTSISLSSSYKSILVGQVLDLRSMEVTLYYSNGDERTTTVGNSEISLTHYTLSHTSVSNKVITGVSYGSDSYYVEYGNVSARLDIRVYQIEITPSNASIDVHGTQVYSARLINFNGGYTNVTVTWSSGDSSIATISGTSTTGSSTVSPTTRTATGVGNGTVAIIASYDGTYGKGSASATLTVNDSIISTTTETETDTEYRNQNLDDTSEDTDYTASVKINNKTSETVDCSSHTVTVTKSGTHTHTVYSNVQPQKRTGTRTRTKYTWASGNVTYGDWSDWTWGAWTNNGAVVTTQKSRQTGINDASSMTISGFTSWFTSSGSVSANSTTSARTATLIVTNGTASASATLTQEGQAVVTEHELVLTGSAVTTKVGKSVSVVRTAKFYTITKVNGVETGRTYTTVNATLSSNNTSIATVDNTTSKVAGVSVGTTSLKGKYTYDGQTYTSTNTIGVTVNAGSDWGVNDDNDPGSGGPEGGEYDHNN